MKERVSTRKPTAAPIRGLTSVKPNQFSAISVRTSISRRNHELLCFYRSSLKQLLLVLLQLPDFELRGMIAYRGPARAGRSLV